MRKADPFTEPAKRGRPALTPEARENQLISLTMDLVEQRLRDGTASASETVHFLKAASSKERLEIERLRHENELLVAKTEALQSAKDIKELYEKALTSMRTYSGNGGSDEEL